jgi:hypothetical protein
VNDNKIMTETGSYDHYFPRWLLRHWCDETNELWCFDKKTQSVRKKGPASFANEQDLYKTDLLRLDLESTIFGELDSRHGRHVDVMSWHTLYGNTKRVPNNVCHFFIELCLWTSLRNKRVQGWSHVDGIKEGLCKDGIGEKFTDAALRKAIHLQSCKFMHDSGTIAKEIERLKRQCFYFFVLSEDGKLITSDMPVQEVGSEFGEEGLGCEPIDDDECALILFPLYPQMMFVATRHEKFKDYHRQLVVDDDFVDANYNAHVNSDSEELYFPYRIFTPSNMPKELLADLIIKKTEGVPCAVDLEYYKKSAVACIIHSNWDGGQA